MLFRSDGSIAEVRTATGSQLVRSASNIDVTGGKGIASAARIVNTGANNQQVGESQIFCCTFVNPYQTANITLAAGAGNDAVAEVLSAAGQQNVFVRFGTLAVNGGQGANAYARIESASTNTQIIGFSGGNQIGTISLAAGSGTGSYSRIQSAGAQQIRSSTAINLSGNGTDAFASIVGLGQSLSTGTTSLKAGAGNNANALIKATGDQTFSGGISLTGGGAAGSVATAQVTATGNQNVTGSGTFTFTGGASDNSFARMSSGGNQNINFSSLTLNGGAFAGTAASLVAAGTQTLSGGNITLKAGGAAATPAGGAHALIEGKSQQVNAGSITITGGTGSVELGGVSDALLRNLDGKQTVNASSIAVIGGAADRKSTRLNSSHVSESRMPSSA